jgi:hypothetical protein
VAVSHLSCFVLRKQITLPIEKKYSVLECVCVSGEGGSRCCVFFSDPVVAKEGCNVHFVVNFLFCLFAKGADNCTLWFEFDFGIVKKGSISFMWKGKFVNLGSCCYSQKQRNLIFISFARIVLVREMTHCRG